MSDSDSSSNGLDQECEQSEPNSKKRRFTTSQNIISTKKLVNSRRAEDITMAICKMIAIDMLPTSIVENEGFIQFMAISVPGYKVPSRRTIDNRMRTLYNEAAEQVRTTLDKVNAVAITTDAWTSKANDSYITLSAHYLDDNWIPHTVNLMTREMTESHTAEHLQKTIREVVQEWNLTNKVTGLVHDNASNIVKAAKELGDTDGMLSVRCAAHTIQLSVNTALEAPECVSVIKKEAEIVSAFRHFYSRTTALEDKLKSLGLPTLRLMQRCPTRWDSTFFMLDRLQTLRSGIMAALSDRSVFKSAIAAKLELCEAEWVKVMQLTVLLKPFQQATTILCAEKSITLSIVRPIIYNLINRHLLVKDDDSSLQRTFKVRAALDLTDRFKMENINVNNEVTAMQMATLLDPRHKKLIGEPSESVRSFIHTEVQRRTNLNHRHLATPNGNEQRQGSTVMDFLLGMDENHEGDDFAKYVAETQIDHNLDLCAWWKAHEVCFPAVAKIARQILCIPASSATAERVFSSAGNIVSAKRSCLLPENVSHLIFLHQNRSFI
ncbi:E3 SUMO-protein ligase ZBED1-like [Temnothorax americanus]|uniref:E3 SUMO-protein ligase ZBED1-like n=1 Tax=Temnothorax americanus TaxID=1964332 RepID=UPI0040692408